MAAAGTVDLGFSDQKLNGSKQELGRRSVAFHPDVWGDYFIKLSQDEKKLDEWSKRCKELNEKVLRMLSSTDGPEKLDLIDNLCRLGISYHFDEEMEEALRKIYSTYTDDASEDNLYTLALRFRLLRQNGFNPSSNAFTKFKEANGNFKEKLASDVMGLLSLYEASYVGTRDDHILDEAIAFTTQHLSAALPHIDSLLAGRVAHALELPLQKRLPRLEARYFISVYEQDSAHNEVLLEFAKLDYNILQALHQREIKQLATWWKYLNLVGKMSFVRNRMTECYFWMLGAYFEPQHSRGRIFSAKVTVLTSVVDDLYDVYGTLDELQLFTDAIYRWDIAAMESLPDGIKPLYEAILTCAKEFEDELTLEGNAYRMRYWKEAVQDICREYFLEAKWFCEGCNPQVEEYLRCGEISAGYPLAIPSCLLGAVEDATEKVFEWIKSYPKCIKASSRILRIADDIQSTKFEQVRGHVVSVVQSYMNEYKCSEEMALEKLREIVKLGWKDVNEACLRPISFPRAVMKLILNLTQVVEMLYQFGDGYTFADRETKERITAVLVDQVPI